MGNDKIKRDLMETVIRHVVPAKYLTKDTIYHLNPSGRFVIGGPHGDAGLTGTNKVSMEEIYRLIDRNFDLRPGMIRKALRLRRPIYNKTAAYGHFGRMDADFTWEQAKMM